VNGGVRVIGMLLSIVVNRRIGGDPRYVRCGECGMEASELEGAPLRYLSTTTVRRDGSGETTVMPLEWACPRCGRSGPLAVGELLPAGTEVRCRRSFVCRYRWKVPAGVATVTCPRCYTRQPAAS
jgi:hypothetical protein